MSEALAVAETTPVNILQIGIRATQPRAWKLLSASIVINALIFTTPASSFDFSTHTNNNQYNATKRIAAIKSGGFDFNIPDGFVSDISRRWGFADGIHLHALWPGLEPRHEGNEADFRTPGGGRKVVIAVRFFRHPERRHMFLTRLVFDPEERKRIIQYPSDFSNRIHAEQIFGLNAAFIDIRKVAEFLAMYEGQSSSSLEGTGLLRWLDLFYRTDHNNTVITLIQCSTRELVDPPEDTITGKTVVPVPGCSHEFVIDEINASVSLSYRRKLLPEWQMIESGVRHALLSFRADVAK